MTRCRHPLPVSLLVTTALFVVTLRADDDRSRYTVAFRAENPWPIGVLGMIAPGWIASRVPGLQATETEELAMGGASAGWPRDSDQS